jgi:hypothetical protein
MLPGANHANVAAHCHIDSIARIDLNHNSVIVGVLDTQK